MLPTRTGAAPHQSLAGRSSRTPNGWSALIVWAGSVVAVLQAIVGVAHLDREAIAFAVFFTIGVVTLIRDRQGGRASMVATVILGLLFADVAFWMITATWSNVWNHEQLLYILEPLALACASTAGLIGVIARLVDRRAGAPPNGAAVVAIAALATFVLGTGVAAAAGWGQEQSQGPGDMDLRIRNTAYSTTQINAPSHQVTLYVTNDDLFWHTVTIDRLNIDLKMPVGSHRRITISAPAGTYTFYCRIPGHVQAGMKGTITIR
jgi:plastocyanin